MNEYNIRKQFAELRSELQRKQTVSNILKQNNAILVNAPRSLWFEPALRPMSNIRSELEFNE